MKPEKVKEAVAFLQGVIPFNNLGEAQLAGIVENMVEERFAPKAIITKTGMHGLNFYIIKSGLVKVSTHEQEHEETVLAFLGEGDCFGEISLLTKGPTTADVQAIENTVCLIQQKEFFLKMVEQYPMLLGFFDQLLTSRLRNSYREILSREPGIVRVEPYIYARQVREMMIPGTTVIPEKVTIREAARIILEKKRGPKIVTDESGNTRGIVGLNTIARSILLEGIDPEEPVSKITEGEFESISIDSYFFDALHAMITSKTNVLVVTDKAKAMGIVTGFDLLKFRGREALSLLVNIERAADVSQLNNMRADVEKVLRELMADGALASHACRIVSEFNDRVVKRVINFAEEICGAPPCPYAWLGLGSEGRKEQTIFTDQDNAIVFASEGSGARDYFTRFSQTIVEGLNGCGIPICRGNVMATNPKFFGGLEQWKARTSDWITSRDPDEKDLMDMYVFLDFRALYGDLSLETALKRHLLFLIDNNPLFLFGLARNIVQIPMPIGFFKNFIVEKSGEHKDRLNLKLFGLVPLVTCTKILGYKYGLSETNTVERIKGLARLKAISNDQEDVLEQAFETFLTLKIRNNLIDIEQGQAFGNYINPAELSTKQKQLLKEAFWAVSQLQKTVQNALNVMV